MANDGYYPSKLMIKTNLILYWMCLPEKVYTNAGISSRILENFLQMQPKDKMYPCKRSSKATDGTSQPQDKVQQLLNLYAKRFYELKNKVLLRLMGMPFKIKNHSKNVQSCQQLSYLKPWLLQKKHVSVSVLQSFHSENELIQYFS